jgi:hypothetical protein
MLKKIESLRLKPKEVRNRYAFWYAFSFTAVIMLFWLVTIPSRLVSLTSLETESPDEIEGGIARSFADLKASLSDGVKSFNKVEDDSLLQEEASTEVFKGDIDFSTFLSTTTVADNQQVVPKKRGKSVLIGTTSQARSSSTDN